MGPHNIITYHHNPNRETKTWSVGGTVYTAATSDCIVTVDGVNATTATPTVDNRNDATCGYAFFVVDAVLCFEEEGCKGGAKVYLYILENH